MRVGDNMALASEIITEARATPLKRMRVRDEAGQEFIIEGFTHEMSDREDDEFVITISKVKDTDG